MRSSVLSTLQRIAACFGGGILISAGYSDITMDGAIGAGVLCMTVGAVLALLSVVLIVKE